MSEERRIDDNENLIEEADTITTAPLPRPLPRLYAELQNYGATHQMTPLVDQAMPSPDKEATAYMTKCYVCGEEITADCYANLRYICPHCRDAVKWLKNHISMLEIILNKEWR